MADDQLTGALAAAEAARREAEERFRHAFDHAPIGMALVDLDGVFVRVNPALCAITGYTTEQLTDATFQDITHPDDLPADLERVGAMLAGRLPEYQMDKRYVRADGSIVWVQLNVSLVRDEDGRPRQFVAQIQDITHRREAEEHIARARDAAVQASELKSRFLANMSHEIRTPMNGVLGMTALLLDTKLDRRQREIADTIRTSGQALLAIVDDILDFSKIEAGRVEVERVAFRAVEVVEDVLRIMGEQARAKGLRLRAAIDDGVPATIVGDPNRLRQVLTNLVSNAVKFTPSGSVTLLLSVPRQHPRCLMFTVDDTGPGIDPHRADALFEPFTQHDPSTTRRYGGTGLGLSISRDLVALMGGELAYEPRPGGGSRFSFWLPMAVGAAGSSGRRWATTPRPEPLFRPGGRPPEVLVVEDNPVNQQVAAGALERLGVAPDIVSDGQQALDALARRRYDAVLMDCQMPVMDGFEAAMRWRAEERSAGRDSSTAAAGDRVPIIAMTAGATDGDRQRCAAAGMDDYLAKPFDLFELHRLLARWIPAVERAVDDPALDQRAVGDAAAVEIPVVDEAALRQFDGLKGKDGGTLISELVDMLAADARARIAGMADALDRRDVRELRRLAHSLRGSALTLGAVRLGSACERLERLSASGLPDRGHRELATVEEELARAVQRLRHLDASPSPT